MMGLFGDILGGVKGAVGGAISGFSGQPKGPQAGIAPQQARFKVPGITSFIARGGVRQMQGFGPPQELPSPEQEKDVVFRPKAILPGGKPFFETIPESRQRIAGQQIPTIGAVGTEPQVVQRAVRRCPTGFVLAIDDRCYPKKMVTRRFRKWPPRRKGPISRSEMNALRKAKRVEKKVKRLGRKITPEGRKTLKIDD